MESKIAAMNVIERHSMGVAHASSGGHCFKAQIAAMEATIAYCQSVRQRYGEHTKALKALCDELGLRNSRVN
jgi:hypothetical protein